MRNGLLYREDLKKQNEKIPRCKLLMRNGLLTSAFHIPLPGLLFPENICNIQLVSTSKLFIAFTKPFLLKGYT